MSQISRAPNSAFVADPPPSRPSERSSGETIERLRQELLSYHRQAQLGAVAGLIAHEFNNLMTPVLARVHDALSRNDAVATQKALTVTAAQVGRALEITRALVGLAEGVSPSREVCSLAEAVKHALDAAVRPLSKDGIETVIDVAADLQVSAAPRMLEQALLNLLLNARESLLPRGGRMSIRAAGDGGVAVIEVSDTGTRFTPEQIDRDVCPFLARDWKSEPCDWQSLGLGLNIVRTIVQTHSGRIDAFRRGSETVYRMFWPRAKKSG